MNITYLGIPGSFSFIAAQKYFGANSPMRGEKTVKKVFGSLATGAADFGVVPVENSTTGSILETYDQLMENKLHIVGEVKLKIRHNLLGIRKDANLKKVKTCYSHPQAIFQCQKFFDSHEWITPEPATDTASAAQILANLKNECAVAIAGRQTAEFYGLKIIKSGIEDNKNNFTRFAVIGFKLNKKGEKATVVFSVKHVPGSLFKALAPYADLGLNLTKIESRPIFGKSWEYIFFTDFEIGKDMRKFHALIEKMKKVTDWVTVLGIYKRGETYET